ncbi:MAG: L-lactate permease [Trueperaceae bacterium]|nr:L-lactate permease [Trueperaceae bacterium]
MPAWVDASLAASPIVVILVAMLGLGWSAARAGAAGLAVALAVAWWGFGYGTRTLPDLGPVMASGGALLEAMFIAATILWIIFPALCIHELQSRTGALEVLRRAMGRLSPDPRIGALLVAWFFVLFVEGAAGFGTSVALAAPFLVAAGFGRVEAVTIALVGHAVGVSFGAVGTPILPQMAVTPFTGRELASATAAYHALAGWVMPLLAMLLVTRALPSARGGPAIWGWTLLAAAAFLVPFYAIARFVGPELPTLAGSLVGGAVFVAALTLVRRLRGTHDEEAAEAQPSGGLLRAGAPYLALIGLVLITRLLPGVRDALSEATVAWGLSGVFSGAFAPLYHPGTMLMAGFLAGAALQRAATGEVTGAAWRALRQLAPVTLALVAMLAISRVMVYAGMIDALAVAAAAAAGGAWPLFAPFVGVLGTFVTGSATASNILFTDFQFATAERLGRPALPLLGAQGFGAAVGNIVCPHNIIAAGATVNLAGREGEVLRRTLPVALLYAAMGGVLAWWVFG